MAVMKMVAAMLVLGNDAVINAVPMVEVPRKGFVDREGWHEVPILEIHTPFVPLFSFALQIRGGA